MTIRIRQLARLKLVESAHWTCLFGPTPLRSIARPRSPYRPGHGPTVINDEKLAAKNDSIRSARQAYQLWSQPLIADVAREVSKAPDSPEP